MHDVLMNVRNQPEPQDLSIVLPTEGKGLKDVRSEAA
jgi:hypothetical protein